MPTALVTGAGSGTGREYVRLLLADGFRVVAVSLLDDELRALHHDLPAADGQLVTLRRDLADPGVAVELSRWCDGHDLTIDVLVCNAGVATYGLAGEVDLVRTTAMLRLNVIATTELALTFAEPMRRRGRGRILVMGSLAGLAPTARLAAYGASKAYVNAFGHALGADLAARGVSVTVVMPGTFVSGFAAAADIDVDHGTTAMARRYRAERMSAAEVAAAGYRGLMAGKRTVVVGRNARVATVGARLFPPAVIARLTRSY